jgi:transcription termination factor Rho
MNPTFRQRQGAGAAGGNNNNNNRRRRGPRQSTEGLPKGDTQIDPELLPETDFSHYDDMPPAELLKLAKKHKISADLLKYEVIEALLVKVNAEKDAIYAKGILEIMNDGWGFLRKDTYQPSPEDTYVGQTLIKKMNLRAGDILFGLCKPQKEGERYRGLFRVESVNNQGITTFTAKPRKNFDELTPLFPDERLVMETSPDNIPTRIVDLISPIGKGQRALIVSPPKAGKTTMMKSIANAVAANHPEVFLMVLLVDERPEEVTDMRRSVRGQVISSTFDEPAENHMRVAELCMEQAKRLVESGRDVVIMLDSLTRLSRASNLTINPSGRTLTGGLDPSALYRPRRFFGAARNIEEGGSLTIIASVLVDTGSKMDESIFEELKGTGNSEIILDRELSERRIWPAIDVRRSSTRQEQLLFNPNIYQGVVQLRRLMAKEQNSMEATEQFIKLIKRTPNNAAFIESVIQRTSAAV